MTKRQEEDVSGDVAVVDSCRFPSNLAQLEQIGRLIEMASKRIKMTIMLKRITESADLKVASIWLKVALDYTDELIERCEDVE